MDWVKFLTLMAAAVPQELQLAAAIISAVSQAHTDAAAEGKTLQMSVQALPATTTTP